MSLYIVDIHGELEGDYEIIRKYEEPTTKNDKVDCEHTDCKNCVNHKYCDYEPFINKPCVSSRVCEHDKNKVLDKLRAEIETKYGQCDICEYFEDYDYEENDISEYRPIGNIADILQILDKYKAEAEAEDGNVDN